MSKIFRFGSFIILLLCLQQVNPIGFNTGANAGFNVGFNGYLNGNANAKAKTDATTESEATQNEENPYLGETQQCRVKSSKPKKDHDNEDYVKLSKELDELKNLIELHLYHTESQYNEVIEKLKMDCEPEEEEQPDACPSTENTSSSDKSRPYDENLNCIDPNCPTDDNCDIGVPRDGYFALKIPNTDLAPFYTYCRHDGDTKEVWTVILRREFGSENFFRNFYDYVRGFGAVTRDFWIGLERLFQITNAEPHALKIILEAYNGSYEIVRYMEFLVGSKDEGYKLTVGKYNGSIEDSLAEHNGKMFSTYDINNTDEEKNCARWHKGGWWFTNWSANCFTAYFNGRFFSWSNRNTSSGIRWTSWIDESLRRLTMYMIPLSKLKKN